MLHPDGDPGAQGWLDGGSPEFDLLLGMPVGANRSSAGDRNAACLSMNIVWDWLEMVISPRVVAAPQLGFIRV